MVRRLGVGGHWLLRRLTSSSSMAMNVTSLNRIFCDYDDSGDDSNQRENN
jgi:hypothetical protein